MLISVPSYACYISRLFLSEFFLDHNFHIFSKYDFGRYNFLFQMQSELTIQTLQLQCQIFKCIRTNGPINGYTRFLSVFRQIFVDPLEPSCYCM